MHRRDGQPPKQPCLLHQRAHVLRAACQPVGEESQLLEGQGCQAGGHALQVALHTPGGSRVGG